LTNDHCIKIVGMTRKTSQPPCTSVRFSKESRVAEAKAAQDKRNSPFIDLLITQLREKAKP
jgi:hypothetical protein